MKSTPNQQITSMFRTADDLFCNKGLPLDLIMLQGIAPMARAKFSESM